MTPHGWRPALVVAVVLSILLSPIVLSAANSPGLAAACPLLSDFPRVADAPITVENLGAAPTGPYDQLLNLSAQNYSPYIDSNFSNVYFTDGSGACVPAWIEANATAQSTDTPIWVSLGSIAAHSSDQLYLDFASASSFVLSSAGPIGESPLLSPVYGGFDDGSLVFPAYWNFTVVPVGWNATGNVTVHDGASVRGAASELSIGSPEWFAPLVVDWYGTAGFSGGTGFFGATLGAVTAFDDTGWGDDSGFSPARAFYNIQAYPAGGTFNASVSSAGKTGVYTFDWTGAHDSSLRFDYGRAVDSVHVSTATTWSSPGFQVVNGPTVSVFWLRAHTCETEPIFVRFGTLPAPCIPTAAALLTPARCV